MKSYNAAHGTAIAIRQGPSLHHIVEQAQRGVTRITRPMLGVKSPALPGVAHPQSFTQKICDKSISSALSVFFSKISDSFQDCRPSFCYAAHVASRGVAPANSRWRPRRASSEDAPGGACAPHTGRQWAARGAARGRDAKDNDGVTLVQDHVTCLGLTGEPHRVRRRHGEVLEHFGHGQQPDLALHELRLSVDPVRLCPALCAP
jgi:hypothetical protein